ncbi:MAG: hypothetical protein IKS29_04975 [Oscillospiraceae bacterium]|nr:hypothetical protein [Oscillospiraceae bacterium]
MQEQGFLTIRAFTSSAYLSVPGAVVAIEDESGQLLALRSTDQDGLAGPIAIDTPPKENSLRPEAGPVCCSVTLRIRHPRFEGMTLQGVQIFPQVESFQPVQLVPLAAHPAAWDRSSMLRIQAQAL